MSLTILRTAAGSAPSVTQYQAFQKLGMRVVAVDSSPLSVGFAFAEASYVVPRADIPGYVEALLRICQRESVDWLLPALDEELTLLAHRRDEFERSGTRILAPSLDCLEICTDKLKTYEFFETNGIPTPKTRNGESLDLSEITEYPQVVKPRSGRGTSNVFVARNVDELRFFVGYVPRPVVQKHICGTELTIDILSDLEARPLFIRPRLRMQTDSGISYKAATVSNAEVSEFASQIASRLGLLGLANIQCFVEQSGGIQFTEVNARLAGTAALTFAADGAFPRVLADLLSGKKLSPAPREAKPLLMLRYWSEVYLEPEQASKLCREP